MRRHFSKLFLFFLLQLQCFEWSISSILYALAWLAKCVGNISMGHNFQHTESFLWWSVTLSIIKSCDADIWCNVPTNMDWELNVKKAGLAACRPALFTEDIGEPQRQVFLHGQQAGFMSTGQPLVVLLHVCEAGADGVFGAQGAAHGSQFTTCRRDTKTAQTQWEPSVWACKGNFRQVSS